MVQGKTTEANNTDHPAQYRSIQTNQQLTSPIPPFLRQMPFLPQPCQFVLSWDRHWICWLVYPVGCYV